MACIVTLELEARPAAFADIAKDTLDVLECVSGRNTTRIFEMLGLPSVLPVLVAILHREQTDAHGAEVERAHLGLGAQRRSEPSFDRHALHAAGVDHEDRVGVLVYGRNEPQEQRGIGTRASALGIACMQVKQSGAGLRRGNRCVRDLLGFDRQMRRHRRRIGTAGDGAGDDCLGALCHIPSASVCFKQERSLFHRDRLRQAVILFLLAAERAILRIEQPSAWAIHRSPRGWYLEVGRMNRQPENRPPSACRRWTKQGKGRPKVDVRDHP